MSHLIATYVSNFFERLDGPLHFRFIMQPLMAIVLAVLGGAKDAREGRRPWAWKLVNVPEQRRHLLADAWRGIGRVFLLAVALDVIYQFIEWRSFRPLGALLTATILAVVPYVLLRGPVNRLLRHFGVHGKQVLGPKV